MRRPNCAGALQYIPELTQMLFLRMLEEKEAREAELVMKCYIKILCLLFPNWTK
jgi:hypothetical protein